MSTVRSVSVTTTSADRTRTLAAALASLLDAGDVVVLAGEMGAGKTTFAQGLARGLGVEAAVTSPSFTLVQHYAGRVPVIHVDVYRIDRVQELHDLGFDEIVDGGAVVMLEWGDVVVQLLPLDRVVVRLVPGDADHERRVTIELEGGRWRGREREVARVVAAG